MKITKHLSAFLMAVLICISFCMTHIAAVQRVSVEYTRDWEYVYFITDCPSMAWAGYTNPGWNEETYTDFEAGTLAQDIVYGTDRNYYVCAYVRVGLYYDDENHTIADSTTSVCRATALGFSTEAVIDGNNLIDMDHGIEIFSTDHEIEICINEGGTLVYIDNYGPTIGITTSY